MKELLLFQVGNRQFGLDLPLVRSIHGASAFFEKQVNDGDSRVPMVRFQFEDMPLYDLSAILGEDLCRQEMKMGSSATSQTQPPSYDPENKKVMLVSVQGSLVALKVDRIERVVSVTSDQIEAISPVFKGTALDWFPRVLKQEKQLILLLNPDGIRWDAAKKSEADALSDEFRELENALTRMMREEEMAKFVLHVSSKILEKMVARRIGKVEKTLRKRLAEEEGTHDK